MGTDRYECSEKYQMFNINNNDENYHLKCFEISCGGCLGKDKVIEVKVVLSPSFNYTLSHPENDSDVTERAPGYTLQDASFMRQSQDLF